ncbi:hypothetical protein A6R71_18405 [Xanthomonas translucens pv. arrhenatheri]|nr:hypothetical protein FD63_10550 [Xanthomonas translucens pv. undulosa]AVY66844.1 hypothetical protein NZ30_11090 [Xanthomonas translucens pv. undulosa]OAX66621.1 hypothetical protein A6R71_18405 [Xanthomonas translucens pv. arrhenatheri]
MLRGVAVVASGEMKPWLSATASGLRFLCGNDTAGILGAHSLGACGLLHGRCSLCVARAMPLKRNGREGVVGYLIFGSFTVCIRRIRE